MTSGAESAAQQPPQPPRLAFGFTRTKTGRLPGASAQPLVADAASAAPPSASQQQQQSGRQLIVAIDGGHIEGAALTAEAAAAAGAGELVVPLPAADQRSWAAAAAAAKRRRLQASAPAAATDAAVAEAAEAAATSSPAVRAILAECRLGGAAEAAAAAAATSVVVQLPAAGAAPPDGDETAAAEAAPAEEEVEDADYGAVPVESFGLAALRGMGYAGSAADLAREGDRRELRVRQRGLGLGAEGPGGAESAGRKPPDAAAATASESAAAATSTDQQQQPPLQWKAGARCRVTAGRDAGHCGTLVSADGDASRWLVSVAQLSGQAKSYPLALLELVSERQFSAGRRLLNTGRVERYRAEQSRRGWPRLGCLVKVCAPGGHAMYARKLRVVRELRDGAACRCAVDGEGDGEDEGRSWEFEAADLETVVPRRRGVRVVVVRGVLSGQLGRTAEDASSQSRADGSVRVRLSESGDCVSLPVDDVCECREEAAAERR